MTKTMLPRYTPTFVLAADSHTRLAEELNAAMDASLEAQIDYLDTWGVLWEPLPLNGYEAPVMTEGRAARAELGTVR